MKDDIKTETIQTLRHSHDLTLKRVKDGQGKDYVLVNDQVMALYKLKIINQFVKDTN